MTQHAHPAPGRVEPEDPTPARARTVPAATVERLPRYLRALDALASQGASTTSSDELARLAGVGPALVRRDLSSLGSHGTRGVGYDVDRLREHFGSALGLGADLAVVIVGIGNLGHALARYMAGGGGFRVAALVDADPAVVGTRVAGLLVEHDADLAFVVEREDAALAVLATPADVAQDVCDRLVAAGVRGILTFVPQTLRVPPEVDLRTVDLATELQILAFHEQRRQAT